MKLSELLKAIQPVQIIGSTEKDITGVNIDSRLVAAGHLFMAMRGTQTDGHAYIPTAIEKGAIAVLCEDMPFSFLCQKMWYLQKYFPTFRAMKQDHRCGRHCFGHLL